MAATTPRGLFLLLLLPLLITESLSIEAQSPSIQTSESLKPSPQIPRFNPTMAAIIASIISAAMLLGMYIYNRVNPPNLLNSAAAASFSVRQKAGLDPAVLDSFPTMLYSDVKEHKLGNSPLECAVCLNEFEDEDSLRLLPKCSHAFHEECIDVWLASHVTCPVCRADLEKGETVEAAEEQVAAAAQAVIVVVEDEEERKELARIASKSRRGGARRKRRLMRSHTTGHIGADLERYTLRLPESVRNEIIVARRLRRERSLPVSGAKGEGDGGSSGRRSLKYGLSAKWPSFFIRSRSEKGFPVDKFLKTSP